MRKFEYKFYNNIFDQKKLNELGSNGWELVNFTNEGRFIFKREIISNKDKNLDLLNEQFSDEITLEKIKED
ncbi:MAG: hypothetical protein CMI90_05725 [Pelagibacteraceae bacterium]|jgi:hypothetical protein|nr:hypothetical protein [Pelagibacteraceae bacterium]|tara:strand:- start:1040 stop:1252 length:213 start_codon:yes stop_codon:yes gene_type:complete